MAPEPPGSERPRAGPRGWSRRRRVLLVWAILCAASWLVVALQRREAEPGPGQRVFEARVFDDAERGRETTGLVYSDSAEGADPGAPAVLLLHGSPGSSRDFRGLAPLLAEERRVVTPDLPGFGASVEPVPDYSIVAHADYALQLLDELGIDSVHVVGFSMGGGVAIELADRAPERVRSVSLLAGIGVQELELFGEYPLNHLVHAFQLGLFQLARYGLPHFGALEGSFFGVPYARNFFDSDQRPLRGMLERYEGPLLVLHGEGDFLVPPAAAREHHRIVPQSELALFPDGHFFLWKRTPRVAAALEDFFARVEAGVALTRAQAAPERVARAAAPFDPRDIPPMSGPGLLILALAIVIGTLVSEDLTCIGAGLLVANGRVELLPAVSACFAGIYFGDMLLYIAGRYVGRPALRYPPLRWMVTEPRLRAASSWFQRKGLRAIFITRLLPGLRLPIYFSAGLLHTRFFTFALYFFIAAAVWTPILVGASAFIGLEADRALDLFERFSLAAMLLVVLAILVFERVVLKLLTHRGRRQLVGSWCRMRKWEYWPVPVFYTPIALWIGWLALKHRSLTLVTAVNPGIPTGGFIGESKSAILDAIGARERVARHVLLPIECSVEERAERARAWMEREGIELPLVCKPDVGQRGSGVRIVEDRAQLDAAIASAGVDVLLQEYVEGREFGVFYCRLPGEPRGRIFSITEKVLPHVTGDGQRTLEELVLDDRRAVCMAKAYFRAHAERLSDVPALGEEVALVRVGTHCRGAVFLDGGWVRTPVLEDEIERISESFEGFWFGRYDLRCESIEALREGRGFRILELNGLTSEAGHVYDPRYTLVQAYRTLFEQWSLAFEIARRNRERGAQPTGLAALAREVRAYRRLQAKHGARGAR